MSKILFFSLLLVGAFPAASKDISLPTFVFESTSDQYKRLYTLENDGNTIQGVERNILGERVDLSVELRDGSVFATRKSGSQVTTFTTDLRSAEALVNRDSEALRVADWALNHHLRSVSTTLLGVSATNKASCGSAIQNLVTAADAMAAACSTGDPTRCLRAVNAYYQARETLFRCYMAEE